LSFGILLFFPVFTESPILHNSVLAVLFKKIIFLHRKFLILWIMQDCGVTEKTKKRISSKESIEKKDKYYKNSVQIWALQLA